MGITERIDRITRALFTGQGHSAGDFGTGPDLLSELARVRQRASQFERWLAAAGLTEQPGRMAGNVAGEAACQEGEKP